MIETAEPAVATAVSLTPGPTAHIDGKGGETRMTTWFAAHLHRFFHSDDGQGLAEYALILALIAIIAIVALIFLGGQISDKLSTIGNSV
jgi:pilus assembly protein Flp/PilA